MTQIKKAELLAPAGCFPSLRAAIASGADAVYFGLAQLNMRARARRSFGAEDLPEIMGICRQGKVKACLTLNTLLYDHDLKLAKKILEKATKEKVDAVIAADMASVQMARELGLEVHLSTQLSVSNYQAFKFYAQFCDRIVLARELSLPLIKKLHEQIVAQDLRGPAGHLMEIEVFAHGALCIAVSGRCGMSLYTDNASANRGACIQNCRREYVVTDKETGQQLEVDNNFIMSPNDISTLEFLDEVITAGVSVLKIEGRARSPEYVSTIVRVYRQILDAVLDGSYTRELVEKVQEDVAKVYNRGFSSGYYLGRKQGWSASYGSQATRQKLEVGKVTHYYGKIGIAEITARNADLSVGDEYVIIGDTSGTVEGVIEELRLEEASVQQVKRGDVFSIKVSGKVRLNDKLYVLKEIKKINA